MYFEIRDNFKIYLYEKFSEHYSKEVFSTLEKIFILYKVKTVEEYKTLISSKKINERASKTAYRVFLNYLEHKELVSEDIIFKLRKKIKLNIKSNIDTFVPSLNDINKSLRLIEELHQKQYYIFYKLIIESGCRPSELVEMIMNFDPKNIEIVDEIVIYRNFYLRDSKNSFYLFFTKKTFNELLQFDFNKINLKYLNSFKEKIVRNKDIISLKYLRKYQFTQMIKCDIDFEIANFIQGRSSKNIGFNHYLAKKEIAVKEYKKLIQIQ
jgi:intergrase/recombinase